MKIRKALRKSFKFWKSILKSRKGRWWCSIPRANRGQLPGLLWGLYWVVCGARAALFSLWCVVWAVTSTLHRSTECPAATGSWEEGPGCNWRWIERPSSDWSWTGRPSIDWEEGPAVIGLWRWRGRPNRERRWWGMASGDWKWRGRYSSELRWKGMPSSDWRWRGRPSSDCRRRRRPSNDRRW